MPSYSFNIPSGLSTGLGSKEGSDRMDIKGSDR